MNSAFLNTPLRTLAQALADRDAQYFNFYAHPKTGKPYIEQSEALSLNAAVESILDYPGEYLFSHCKWKQGLAEVDLSDLVEDARIEEAAERKYEEQTRSDYYAGVRVG